MLSVVAFGKDWYQNAASPLRRADPLLMGAAFAYNALFALVPLALAFVTVLSLLDIGSQVLDDLSEFINDAFSPEIASFLTEILTDSVGVVEDNRRIIVVVTLLIALWSGSRAVYAVQKALRLVQDSDVEVGYVRMRTTGVIVTFAAGVAVVIAYAVILLGGRTADAVTVDLWWTGETVAQVGLVVVAALWVFGLLYAIYRWGAPAPLQYAARISASVTSMLFLGSWFLFNLVPSNAVAAVAVFGAIGAILLWLYGVGILVVGAPIAVGSFLDALRASRQRR